MPANTVRLPHSSSPFIGLADAHRTQDADVGLFRELSGDPLCVAQRKSKLPSPQNLPNIFARGTGLNSFAVINPAPPIPSIRLEVHF
jgi:hypothetical protein